MRKTSAKGFVGTTSSTHISEIRRNALPSPRRRDGNLVNDDESVSSDRRTAGEFLHLSQTNCPANTDVFNAQIDAARDCSSDNHLMKRSPQRRALLVSSITTFTHRMAASGGLDDNRWLSASEVARSPRRWSRAGRWSRKGGRGL